MLLLNPGVFRRELVATFAVSLGCVLCRDGLTSKQIHATGDRLEVGRVTAGPGATQVVEVQSGRDLPDEDLICVSVHEYPMFLVTKDSIAVRTQRALPYPTAVRVNLDQFTNPLAGI